MKKKKTLIQKKAIINEYRESGKTAKEICVKYNIAPSTLYLWQKEYMTNINKKRRYDPKHKNTLLLLFQNSPLNKKEFAYKYNIPYKTFCSWFTGSKSNLKRYGFMISCFVLACIISIILAFAVFVKGPHV